MQALREVADAKALMTQAKDWPVMKWLMEKKRVREVADRANSTLDRVEQEIHESWHDTLKDAYAHANGKSNGAPAPSELDRLAKEIKEVHDAALRARMDAEDTFDKAEKRMSTRMAREGCDKAIAGWILHEQAIRKAQSAATKA